MVLRGAGPELARSLAMLAAPFLAAMLAHLVLAVRGGGAPTRAAWAAVAASYASAVAVSTGRAVLYDPFLDRFCWSNCTSNSFLVYADPVMARRIGVAGLVVTGLVGALTAAGAVWRLVHATAVGRSALSPILVPAAVAAAAEAAYAVTLLTHPAEDPAREPFTALFVARAVALTLLAGGLAWSVIHARRRRLAVARLADELGAAPPLGSLRAALAQALGDDTLDVGYWLPDARRYVDASGRSFEPRAGRDRAVTSLRRVGVPVAVVVHDRSRYGEERLEREIGSAARLAIDNERLRAALLAQLADLRASRARIVEKGDEARRRIERDLHDGAQQRLLAVAYELRVAAAAAHAAGDKRLAARLGAAVDDAQVALAELRDIAHGIFPAVLDEAGLGPALWSLADRAPIPVDIEEVPDERCTTSAERAVYAVVTGAVEAAAPNSGTALGVRIDRTRGVLVVDVRGAAGGTYDHVADRVGALGGRLTVEPDRLRAEIPCE
jgi:signal transduction histidine kinase